MKIRNSSNWVMNIKKISFLAFLLPIFLVFISPILGSIFNMPNLFAYFTLFVIFVVVTVADYAIGKDLADPSPEQQKIMEEQPYYRYLTLACLPLVFLMILYGEMYFASGRLNLIGKIGWILTVGMIASAIGVTVAHELIHKNNLHERVFGGLLLSLVGYASFKVEHIRGHHMWVSTDKDTASAAYNQSLYNFLYHSVKNNFINGWILEKNRLISRGEAPFGWRNELIGWYAVTILFAIAMTIIWGFSGLLFFVLQCFVAILLMESVNYIEHYGLRRKKTENGSYERVGEVHSWNSNYLLTNILFFHIQRHSDHHMMAKRRYQAMIHSEVGPQLPGGYPAMLLLALVPKAWFAVINPRVPVDQLEHSLTKEAA